MCLNTGIPKNINFLFETNGKLMVLGVPILKLFRVCIPFNQTLDEKSHISAKTEAVKQNSADIQSDCSEPWFILTSLTLHGLMLLLEYKLHKLP